METIVHLQHKHREVVGTLCLRRITEHYTEVGLEGGALCISLRFIHHCYTPMLDKPSAQKHGVMRSGLMLNLTALCIQTRRPLFELRNEYHKRSTQQQNQF